MCLLVALILFATSVCVGLVVCLRLHLGGFVTGVVMLAVVWVWFNGLCLR